jgi:hypothetical protein
MQKFTDPSFLLDQLSMHDGDLARRSAKADKPEFEPETKRFGKGRSLHRHDVGVPLEFVSVLGRHLAAQFLTTDRMDNAQLEVLEKHWSATIALPS